MMNDLGIIFGTLLVICSVVLCLIFRSFLAMVVGAILGLVIYQFYILPRHEEWLIQLFQSLP